MTEYAATLDEIAELFGISKKSLHNFKNDGMTFPPKTAKGYNIERFKANFEKYQESRAKAGTGLDLKEQKLTKEIEKLGVNIAIDNERLKQHELETQRQRGAMIAREEHEAIVLGIVRQFVAALDQHVENVSTKLRDARARDMLQTSIDSIRAQLSREIKAE